MEQEPIKKYLLEEAQERLERVKEASLDKQGMSYLAGQADFNNAVVNFRIFPRETGKRVEDIRNEIENTFGTFMKERTAAVDAGFSETGQAQPRAKKRTVIVPQLASSPAAQIDLPPDTATMQLSGFPRAGGAKDGTIYFRWGWKRT